MNIAATTIGLVTRYWPFANGSERLIYMLEKRIDTGKGEKTCMTSDGFPMAVDADDLIGRHLILSGRFDRSTAAVLMDFSKPGDHVVDIGANIGYISCLFLKNIPGVHVMAVEPQTGVVGKLLAENLAQFPRHQWTLIPAALSDKDVDMHLWVSPGNAGAAVIVPDAQEHSVPIRLVDSNRVLGELPEIDLIKIDTEGHEETVFLAAKDVIEAKQPRAILFEDQLSKSHPQGAIGKLLNDIGYSVYGVDKGLFSTKLTPVTEANKAKFNDYLAVSKRKPIPLALREKYRINL